MSMMRLNLALLFVFDFALLNFCARDGHNFLGQFFETLKRRFFWPWVGFWHSRQYAQLEIGSNVASFSRIASASIVSIFPLTLNNLFLSVSGSRSFPLVETSIATIGRMSVCDCTKYAVVCRSSNRVAELKDSFQSTGSPRNVCLIRSFWYWNISELIFSAICPGVNLIGSSGRGVSATALDCSGVIGGGVSDSGWMINGFCRRHWLSVYQNRKAKMAAITASPNVQAIKTL